MDFTGPTAIFLGNLKTAKFSAFKYMEKLDLKNIHNNNINKQKKTPFQKSMTIKQI